MLLALFPVLLASCGGGSPSGSAPSPQPGTGPVPAAASAYAATGNALYRVALSGSGTDTKLADLAPASPITDLAWDGSTLYGVTFSQLLKIDVASGAITVVGSLGVGDMNALTFDKNGNLYGAGNGGAFYTVNKATGAASNVGPMGFFSSGDLAFTADGTLYAAGTLDPFGPDSLIRIDLGTGKGTAVGSIGFNLVFGLNVQGSVLYGLTSAGQLLTINTSTGAGTLVRDTGLPVTGLQ